MKRYFIIKLIVITCVLCSTMLCACGGGKAYSGDGGKNHTHLYGLWQKVSDPTCTEEGARDRYCSCGDRQVVIISPLGHDFIVHSERQATCTEVGWHEYKTCLRCDYTDYSEIPCLDHKFSEWVLDDKYKATCIKPGHEIRICSVGSHIETRETALADHVAGEWIIKDAPTCDIAGMKVKKCEVCNCELETEQLAPLGHKWDNGICVVCGCDYVN